MLVYAQLQLDQDERVKDCQKSIKVIDAATDKNKLLDVRMDEIGMAWMIDRTNNIIWHNGGTSNYNSYLGFDPISGTAVVVLSNLSPDYKIPATVLGIKALKEIRS
jgi:hypothetical protein